MFPATNPLTPSKTCRTFRETRKPCPIRKSKWSSHMKSQVAPSAFVSSSRMASPKSTDSSFPESWIPHIQTHPKLDSNWKVVSDYLTWSGNKSFMEISPFLWLNHWLKIHLSLFNQSISQWYSHDISLSLSPNFSITISESWYPLVI